MGEAASHDDTRAMADEKSGKLAFPEPQHHYAAPSDPPPQYEAGSSSFAPAAAGAPPPAGHRVPCSTENNAPMPSIESIGPAPFNDLDGSPVYVVSALIMDQRTGSVQAVHPAKANARFTPPVRLSYGGREVLHQGRYDVLIVTPQMEWVPAKDGKMPKGRRAVEGGFEADGRHLFHARARVNKHPNLWVPGKTGEHLRGANVPFGGREHVVKEYEVLCWR